MKGGPLWWALVPGVGLEVGGSGRKPVRKRLTRLAQAPGQPSARAALVHKEHLCSPGSVLNI